MFSVSLQWWTLQMSPTAKQTTRTNSISSLFSSESFDAVTLLLLLFTGSTLGVFLFFFQRHNWAEIMGNIWNRTCAAVFAYCVPSRLFSRMHFEYFLRCCFSRTNMKTFFFFAIPFCQRKASRPRFSQHLLTGGERGRWYRSLDGGTPKNISTESWHPNQISCEV